MERWRFVWRGALVYLFSTPGLEALRDALREDDPALLQGSTSVPPPSMGSINADVCAACAIGLAAWRGDGLHTVGQIHDEYVRVCHRIDQLLHDPDASGLFIGWYDNQPREVMRRELLREVEQELLVHRAGQRGDCIALRGEPCTESACSS